MSDNYFDANVQPIGTVSFPVSENARDVPVNTIAEHSQKAAFDFISSWLAKKSTYLGNKWEVEKIIDLQNQFDDYFQKNVPKIKQGDNFPETLATELRAVIDDIMKGAPSDEHGRNFLISANNFGKTLIAKAFEAQVLADKGDNKHAIKVLAEKSKANIYENPVSDNFNANVGVMKDALESSIYLQYNEKQELMYEYQVDASESLVTSYVEKSEDLSEARFEEWFKKTAAECPDFLGTYEILHWAHERLLAKKRARKNMAKRWY